MAFPIPSSRAAVSAEDSGRSYLFCSIMAILGGAIRPPLQGYLPDHVGIQVSFLVPMIAFAYIVFYGVYGYRAGRKDLAA